MSALAHDQIGLYVDPEGRGPSIRMVNGERFYILEPDPELITPTVVAHALSQICRFTGHTIVPYSVAEHCVMVSRILPPKLALEGLLHDASEAFIGDISRPMKNVMEVVAPGVLPEIEDRIHEAIAVRFGTGFPHHQRVKDADNIALATELRDLLADPYNVPLQGLPDPLRESIRPRSSTEARALWLARYTELTP